MCVEESRERRFRSLFGAENWFFTGFWTLFDDGKYRRSKQFSQSSHFGSISEFSAVRSDPRIAEYSRRVRRGLRVACDRSFRRVVLVLVARVSPARNCVC